MIEGATAELATFVSNLQLDRVPERVIAHAKLSVLDTVGCVLHGATLPWCRIIQDHVAAEGGRAEATVWGTTQRATATQAAWLNGTAGHAFEFDDVHMGGMIHIGSLTLTAALALAERPDADGAAIDGARVLAAVIAGCEVGARVGRAVTTGHFAAGFHPQGTVGVFASAAAAARVLGLDQSTTQQALGIAGSHAAGLMAAQNGAMTKRLHSGHASQSGVLAALLAVRGFTGIEDVLEVEFGGFLSTMGGPGRDVALLTKGLGEDWETAQIGFKPYPSCAAAQSSIETARRLRADSGLEPEQIAGLTIWTSTHTKLHCGWEYEPNGITAAQMSIPYGVARMLLDGRLSAADFEPAAIAEPRVLDMAKRVRVEPAEDLDALGASRRYVVRSRLKLTDGRVFEDRVDDRPGNSTNPLPESEIVAKYFDLATGAIGLERARGVRQLVHNIDQLDSAGQLATALSVNATTSEDQ